MKKNYSTPYLFMYCLAGAGFPVFGAGAYARLPAVAQF